MCRGLFSVLGPVMVGPSSSHTAGAVRIGAMCRSVSGAELASVSFFLHGSFAQTYRGHGTDRALVGGLLGMKTDDENIINSLDIAKTKGLSVDFIPSDLGNVHPNTVRAEMVTKTGEIFSLITSSVGGGEIKVLSVNGLRTDISGIYDSTIIKHLDKIGIINKVTHLFEIEKLNIVSLYSNRENFGKNAITIIEIDAVPSDTFIKNLSEIDGMFSVSVIYKI